MLSTKDVKLHPAYAKYVLNTTDEDIECMRAVVSVHDQWQQVNNLVRREGLTVRIPSIYNHYKECIWSDPGCKSGPDTCMCSCVSGSCYNIIQLLNRLWKEDENKTTTTNVEDKKYGFYGKLQE